MRESLRVPFIIVSTLVEDDVKIVLNQEPGSNEDIINFAKGYNVTFDLMDKIDVNGVSAIGLYKVIISYCFATVKFNIIK